MKITVVGLGYVGLSMALLLAQKHQVTAVDIDQSRVDMINQKKSPLVDAQIEAYLAKTNLTATTELPTDADFTIVAATNRCRLHHRGHPNQLRPRAKLL